MSNDTEATTLPYTWAYHHVERNHHILYQGYDEKAAKAAFEQAIGQAMQGGDTLRISYDVYFSRHRLPIEQAMQGSAPPEETSTS